MSASVVLLVDDDAAIRRAVGTSLELEGFVVIPASGGRAGLEAVARASPDIVLLDVTMPDLDGISVLERIRADGNDLPVCILSARDEVDDRVRGLQAGADDYIVKPFAIEELVARLHALLRRRPATARTDDAPVSVGDLRLDPAARTSHRGTRSLDLTPREFALLELFLRHPDHVLDRQRLHEDVWGYTFDPQTNVADVFIGYLRRIGGVR